ncbi:hypothetical protein Nazgul32 [Burkholderia phage BcepNazgul]|uniref:Uncharacterized protein n=1 Tax=Burkholderia phage BcepNazgul TaxID=242861 RepID=Q6UYK8_9CAUD|nr:hypothetical protein Nazgul32 [Burkholderia phage BcepNazgul]AAQ63333.1 hypothetical protein Nazgul32 [Burkholderia phage BcepNazgul]
MSNEPKDAAGIITLSIQVSRQLCEDTMDAAAHGVEYWAHAFEHPGCGPETLNYAIEEDEPSSGETPKNFVISPEAIVKGIQAIMHPAFSVRADIRGTLFSALVEDDASNIDIEIADIIVQAAMFGEIIYG